MKKGYFTYVPLIAFVLLLGNWGGLEGVDDAIFPAVMEVDYVPVYQVK